MSTPIVEQIAVALAGVIDSVDGLTCLRPKRVHFVDELTAEGTVVLTQESPEKADATLHTQDWRQPFSVLVIAVDSDAETASIDTRLNALRSDLEKALLADPTLGGLAIDTVIDAPTYFGTAAISGIELKLNVHYRTAYADPYTAA
jgi:hypothetical protein